MNFFKKKESLISSITFMAIMSAIDIIICVLSALFPVAAIFIILFLPLTATLVEIYCKDRYFPIFFIASIGLSLVATLWNIETTIFYLIPSIITGYIFGLGIKKGIPSVYGLLVATLLQMGITLLFIPMINVVFEVDIVDTFVVFFNLKGNEAVYNIVPAFIFAISFIQIILSYIIVINEIRKISDIFDSNKYSWIHELLLLVVSIATIPLGLVSLKVAFVLLLIALYLAIYIIIDYIEQRYFYILIVFGGGLIINIILFSIMHQIMPPYSSLLLVVITPFWISFISLIVSFLKKRPKEIK